MIVFREKTYSHYFSSAKSNVMLNKITAKLDQEREDNYDIDLSIPDDVISVNLDLDHMEIYIPIEFEYSQYTIDNKIRSIASYLRTDVQLDRDIYIMSLTSKVTFDQYYKIIKAIIKEEGFCSIINKD
jgi:hypothetical protein